MTRFQNIVGQVVEGERRWRLMIDFFSQHRKIQGKSSQGKSGDGRLNSDFWIQFQNIPGKSSQGKRAAAACIGEVLMLARESEAAIDQCRSVIAMDASYWAAHSVLGFAYQQKGQHREAVEVGGAEVIAARREVIFQTAVPEP